MRNWDIATMFLISAIGGSLCSNRPRRNGHYSAELLGNTRHLSLWNYIAANITQMKIEKISVPRAADISRIGYRRIYHNHRLTNISVHNKQFEILTAVLIKIQVFWNMMPCRLENNHRCFGEMCCHHLHGTSVGSRFHRNIGNSLPIGMMSSQKT